MADPRPDALPVTPRQLELLRALYRWSQRHGRMPSLRELAAELKRSPSTIHQQLTSLERRGCIERTGGSHGIRLLVAADQLTPPEPPAERQVPLKGRLAPGRALRRLKDPYPTVSVGAGVRAGDYALEVEGERLEQDGIFPGDLLLVRPGAARSQPALVQFPDGTWDIKRVTTLRDGGLGVIAPRPGPANRRGARRAPGLVVQGRILRVIRNFDDDA